MPPKKKQKLDRPAYLHSCNKTSFAKAFLSNETYHQRLHQYIGMIHQLADHASHAPQSRPWRRREEKTEKVHGLLGLYQTRLFAARMDNALLEPGHTEHLQHAHDRAVVVRWKW
jgi:hypothetical protein